MSWSGRRVPALLSAAAVVAASVPTALGVTTAGAAPGSGQGKQRLYIVQVAGAPVASYHGGVPGLRETSPRPGENLDVTSPTARAYRDFLRDRQRATLQRAGLPATRQVVSYSVAFNGYAARLTRREAHALEQTEGVVRVWKNKIVRVDTTDTPQFLGLTRPNGVWMQQFGGPADAGRGVIVGVIDSGFWPESESFAPLAPNAKDDAAIAARFKGVCEAGEEEPVECNNKVIGARFYNESGLAAEEEFLSPRDYNGHGTHTASTAAGLNGVPASINGAPVGRVSGMAPGARISVYKAMWHDFASGGATGGIVDLVSAIDDAVADGVDVINFSISGSSELVVDPISLAFLQAADAGVFVAASAGNAGETVGPSSVAHNAPWVTTVAASTHNRPVTKTLTLGDGRTFRGRGVGPAVPSAPLVDSADAGLGDVDPMASELCFSDADNDPENGVQPALDPDVVDGTIVLCARGVSPRVDKGLAVREAGGVGMILYNPTPDSLNADFHSVPSIHINERAGAAVKEYAATTDPTAEISAVLPEAPRAPEMAAFSSFGPAIAGDGDVLKPDITAPGVDVIAAVAPPANRGNNFDSFSGTSMSSPHIAGLAALMKSRHPRWEPMWIKSALMTTANAQDRTGQQIQRGDAAATPLDFGSGHVRPRHMFEPGLVYDAGFDDWVRYGCGLGQLQIVAPPGTCQAAGSIDASSLNYPTIAVGDLAGQRTVKRTVTSVARQPGTYRISVDAPTGVDVTVSPTTLVVPPGQQRSFKVTFTRSGAALGEWAFGSLTLSDGQGHVVRSVIAARPVALAVPDERVLTGTEGTATMRVLPGYTGTLNAGVDGLEPAEVTPLDLDSGGPVFDPFAPAESARTGLVPFTVAGDTTVARIATFDADYPTGTDVDIFVYQVAGDARALVALSGGATAQEDVTLFDPPPGSYEAYVDLFEAPGGTQTVEPNLWLVGRAAAGNMTVSPESQQVTTAQPATVDLSWSGLTADTRYLGVVRFGNGQQPVGRTLVMVR